MDIILKKKKKKKRATSRGHCASKKMDEHGASSLSYLGWGKFQLEAQIRYRCGHIGRPGQLWIQNRDLISIASLSMLYAMTQKYDILACALKSYSANTYRK